MNRPTISVCIPTFRRPDRLKALLHDLGAQTLPPSQVVVVDNDVERSGEPAVRSYIAECPSQQPIFQLVYDSQPERNISLTRNLTVSLAHGEWLAFIDDDERPPTDWLECMLAAAGQWQAQGILAPVLPVVPESAPGWIRKGRFYDFPRMPSGTVVPLNQLRFGNVLLKGDVVRAEPGPFDPSFRLSTGEDADMLLRLIAKGAKVVWCDTACIEEPVELGRLSFNWLMRRAYSGGQEYARKALAGHYGTKGWTNATRLLVDTLLKLIVAVVLVPASLPLGRHRAAHWLLRAQANLGKLAAFSGQRYQEYRKA
jgi:succinoglycan biosynthesis protein ExoM